MDTMSDVLDRLAIEIERDLHGKDVSLSQKLEAFKILSAREASVTKKNARSKATDTDPEDDSDAGDVPDFRNMASRIRKVG